MPIVVSDFRSDWIAFLGSWLGKKGYAVGPDVKLDDVSVLFFNVQRRLIARRPRKVLTAIEFGRPDDLAAGLAQFTKEAERGDYLTPRQSKKLLHADFNDGLLNAWDIHHFHLGTERDPSDPRFVQRTDQVLFARVTDDTVYMLDVAKHGAWSEQRFVHVILRNWPESLEMYRLNAVAGPERSVSDKEVAALRSAGVELMPQGPDGAVYFPFGGGIATSRRSMQVVQRSCNHLDRIRRLEESVRASANDILAEIGRHGLVAGDPMHLELHIDWDKIRVVETKTGYVVRLLETWA